MQRSIVLIATLWAGVTQAHEGHGLTGSHWHATDTLGYLVAAAIAVVAIWYSRRK